MGLKRVRCFVFGLVGLLIIATKGEDDDSDDVVYRGKEYSAIYNFGDSNSDTGTFSAAFAMVFPPNGENFPQKLPTRNCDGRLIIDFICKHKPNFLFYLIPKQYLSVKNERRESSPLQNIILRIFIELE